MCTHVNGGFPALSALCERCSFKETCSGKHRHVCLLYAAGDISQQTIRQTDNYDFTNTARVTAAGGGFGGPFYYYWYKFLDSCLPGTTPKTIVKKVLFDQAVAGIFGTFMFYTGTNTDVYTFSFKLKNSLQIKAHELKYLSYVCCVDVQY